MSTLIEKFDNKEEAIAQRHAWENEFCGEFLR